MAIRDLIMRIKTKVTGQKDVQGLKLSFTELNQALELTQKAFGVIDRVSGATFRTLEQGLNVQNLTRGFDNLQSSVNALGNDSLRNLQDTTRGLISDMELMRQANQAVLLGVDDGSGRFAEFAGASLKLGASMGDLERALESGTVGLGRMSRQMLDNLGVILPVSEANEEYAAKIGKTVEQLTDQEQKLAFVSVGMDRIIEKASVLSDLEINAALAAKQLAVEIDNQKNAFASAFGESEALEGALEDLTEALGDVDVKTLATELANVASFFINAASAAVKFGNAIVDLAGEFSREINQLKELNKGILETTQSRESAAKKAKLIAREVLELQKELNETDKVEVETRAKIMAQIEEKAKLLTQLNKITRDGVEVKKEENKVDKESLKVKAELTEALDDLSKSYKELENDIKQDSLKNALEEAIKAGNAADFEELKTKLEEATADGIAAAYGKLASDPAVQAAAKKEAELRVGIYTSELTKKTEEEQTKALEEAHKESVDFYQSLMVDAINGDIGDAFESIATRFVTQIVAEFLASNVGGSSIQGALGNLLGGSSGGGGFSIPGIGGGGLGGILEGALAPFLGTIGPLTQGGSIAAGITPFLGAAGVAGLGISGIQKFTSGDDLNFAEQAALSIPTFGLSFASNLFGNGKNPTEQARDAFKDALKDVLGPNLEFGGVGGPISLFGKDFGANLDLNNEKISKGIELTKAFSLALAGGGELGIGVNSVFAQAVAEGDNLTEVVINATSLMDSLGLTTDSVKQNLADAFLDGAVSLDEFNHGLNSLSIVGAGNIESAGDAFIAMAKTIDTDARTSLISLQKGFEKLEQDGINSAEGIRAYFTDTLGPEAADSIARLFESGLTDFENLSDLSVEQLQFLANEIKKISGELGESGIIGIGEGADEAANAATAANDEMIRSYRELDNSIGNVAGSLDNLRRKAEATASGIVSSVRRATSEVRNLNESLNQGSI